LVAIFTYHDAEGDKAGKDNFQTQGIAYSLDNGETWIKYEDNPVIRNLGFRDFRDPKVFWNQKGNNWSMLLVAGDHLQIWQSPDLKQWDKVSEFGKNQGAHGGVWECPDMFPLKVEGTDLEKWVLLISINPGAPNGGSGTQYFIGDFDGKTFTTDQQEHKWIDWGTDNYAGVTFNNTPNNERIFIGWMSNWAYAQETPTEKWRSAMTLPRKLALRSINDSLELINYPVDGFNKLRVLGQGEEISIDAKTERSFNFDYFNSSEIKFKTTSQGFSLEFSNSLGETLNLILDGDNQKFVLDRSKSGKTDFDADFAKNVQTMPIPNLPKGEFEVRILMDWSSIEVFINEGQYVMTAQIFPNQFYRNLVISNPIEVELELHEFSISPIKSIW
jgi:fructan beta-fructosidase